MKLILPGFLSAICFLTLALAHPTHDQELPHWQKATGWPDRIITTYADDPQTTISVTWRTNPSVGRTIAQIAPATPDARFDLAADTFKAKTEHLDLDHMETADGVGDAHENYGLGRVHYHSITFENLKPDTLYAWRVQGARGKWSEWFQTRTAPAEGPVTFVYFGDAQQGIRSHWSRMIRAAANAAPDADFYLHAGDLVMKGDSDYNWAEWFNAGGFIHAMVPTIPVPGNHENIPVYPVGTEGGRVRSMTPFWRKQFALPVVESLPKRLHETVYDVRVSSDLHVFVLESALYHFNEQAEWLDEVLTLSDARWKVVSMHHPYFMPAALDRRERDGRRRAAFTPVINKHEVDLVLTGHIHTYARNTRLEPQETTSRTAEGDEKGIRTVFTISSSGASVGNIEGALNLQAVGDGKPDLGELSIDRVAGNTPMFQVIRLNGDHLTYEAHMATGEVYDSFALRKLANGRKLLIEGQPEYGETRLFSNTGPYREWWDLR